MIRLHHCHEARSMRVLWLLHELDAPFELTVHPFGKALRHPDYLRVHPAGRVPGLEIDGEVIFESGAMIELLCDRFPKPGLGRAPGDPERAQWLQWVHFAETISQHVANLTQQHIMLYEDHMRSPTVMKLEARRLAKCYGALELALDGRECLLGTGFSGADIAVGQAVYMARHFAPLDDVPQVSAWYDRLEARPAFQASLPPEGAETIYQGRVFEVPDA
jgi:glutathione S-transferase